MTAKQIYKETKKFPVRLLAINMAIVGVSLIWCLLLCGLGFLFKNNGLMIGGAISTVIIYSVASGIVNHYIAYMFKYGSVYAIMRASVDGKVSPTYFDDSLEYIKNGFIKANLYLVLDKLVSSAVRGVTRLVNGILAFLPNQIKQFIDVFLNMYLNYIDECCLAYSMMHSDENVAKTSCDGVTLYFQNAKGFLAPALKTTLRIVITYFIFTVIGIVLFAIPPLAVIWILCSWAIISPFLRHRVLCDLITSYLDYAKTAELKVDVYNKLCNVKAFQKLRDKMSDPDFNPAPGNPSYTQEVMNSMSTVSTNNGSADSTVQQANPIPIPSSNPIPPPPVNPLTQEEMMWQQAWNRMNENQRKTYISMQPAQQQAWKKQILKALFNYDMP